MYTSCSDTIRIGADTIHRLVEGKLLVVLTISRSGDLLKLFKVSPLAMSVEVSYSCVMDVTTSWDKLKHTRVYQNIAGELIFSRYVDSDDPKRRESPRPHHDSLHLF